MSSVYHTSTHDRPLAGLLKDVHDMLGRTMNDGRNAGQIYIGDDARSVVWWPLGVAFAYEMPSGGSRARGPLLQLVVRYLCGQCGNPVIYINPTTAGDVIAAVVVHERIQHGNEVLDPEMWEAK